MEISSSRSSSASMKLGVSVIARKQAKVEAARAMKFTEQERNLMKQKIKLDEDEKMQKIEPESKKGRAQIKSARTGEETGGSRSRGWRS